MMNILVGLSSGLGVGAGISFLICSFLKKQKISQSRQEAFHIIQTAKDSAEQEHERIINKMDDFKSHILKRQEKEQNLISKSCHRLERAIEKIKQQNRRGVKSIKTLKEKED